MATRWEPDTCDCILHYDAEDGGAKLVCTAVETACDIHREFAGPQAVLDNCLELNRAWNSVQPHG